MPRPLQFLLRYLLLWGGMALPLCSQGQTDSARIEQVNRRVTDLDNKLKEYIVRLRINKPNTFYLYKYLQVQDSSHKQHPLTFSGYVDAYYVHYLDSTGSEYARFPTVSPRSGQFALNMLYFSAKYQAEKARAMVGLHMGDIPSSAWAPGLNLIQEANAGLRIAPKLWLDAGYFRTHIGMESIQPRENICHSLASTTYFEPYFLSGAKLSYSPNDKLTLQVNAFNGFNTFTETNRNKALGFSAVYAFSNASIITFNTLVCDESPDSIPFPKTRVYNDLYYVYRSTKLDFGAEANFGLQQNSQLNDASKMALMYSFILAAKYKTKHLGFYGRGELFEDSNELLTGPLENENHQLVGLNLWGATAGIEFRPIETSYLRLEARHLQTTPDETIFHWQGKARHQRQEVITALGVWF
jgi:hypothetical protein